jgi:biofilm protein TabA
MIIDRIENRAFYRQLGSRIGEALEYLATDFTKLPDGKYELDGPRMFAIVQRYRPKPLMEIAWESHRKYIDVQYIVTGAEWMGFVSLDKRLPIKQDYEPERDVVFYEVQCGVDPLVPKGDSPIFVDTKIETVPKADLFTVSAGSFVVFAPHDVHAPALAVDNPHAVGEVLKVVVKIEARG